MSDVSAEANGQTAEPTNPATWDDVIAQLTEQANAEVVQDATEPPAESQESETPQATAQDRPAEGDKEADDTKPIFSRRDAERLAAELEKTKAEKAQVDQQLQAQQEQLDALGKEVEKALGTEEEIARLESQALNVQLDVQARNKAAETLRIYKDNRKFYGKLFDHAKSEALNSVVADFEEAAKLEGVDRKTLFGTELKDSFKHVYEAGRKSQQAVVDRLEAELKEVKTRSMSQGAPLGGGKAVGDGNVSEWFDPKTGMIRDDIVNLAMTGGLRDISL